MDVKKMIVLAILTAFYGCQPVLATMSNQTARETLYTGDGATTAFTFGFPIDTGSAGSHPDLEVWLRTTATGAQVQQTETTQYSVSATNNDFSSGGTVTMVTAPAATEKLLILRNTPQTQSSDVGSSGVLLTIENALDKLTRQVIDLQERVNRMPKNPKTDVSTLTTTLPSSVDRAGKNFTWDSSGNVTATDNLSTGTANISAFGATLIDDADADAAQTTLSSYTASLNSGTLTTKISPAVNVKAYGAVGDGVTDDTTAFQDAINTKKPVFIPVGRYLISDTLTFPDASGTSIDYAGIITGSGATNISTHLDGTEIAGTILLTPGTFAKPLFKFDTSRNLVFRDFTIVGPGKGDADSIGFHFNVANKDTELTNIVIREFETGIQNGYVGGSQSNDSEVILTNIEFDQLTYGIRAYNSQAYNWNLFGCKFGSQCDTAFKTESDGGYQGCKIRMYGGLVLSGTAAFVMSGAYGTLYIQGVHFESALTTPPMIISAGTGVSSASIAVTMVGCEINYASADYDTTASLIELTGGGPKVFMGNKFSIKNPIIRTTSGSATFIGNWWQFAPRILSSATTTEVWGARIVIGDYYESYNRFYTSNVTVTHPKPEITFQNEAYATYWNMGAAPTTGTWEWGTMLYDYQPAANGSPGWVCTQSGTFSSATDSTGDTDGSTATITGMTDTSDFYGGQWVTVSAGFPSTTTPYRIMSKTATSITLALNRTSTSAQTNVTVATIDPVFTDMPLLGSGSIITKSIDLTNSEIKALAATPKELVAAPGAGKLLEFVSATLLLDYGSEVLAEPSAPDDLAIEYDDGTGQQIITWDTTGFITSSADAMEIINSASVGGGASAITTAANVNKNIVLINTGGEYTGNMSNDTTLRVIVNYRLHESLGL